MNVALSTERLFSQSCFQALKLVREYGQKHPDLSAEEVVSLVKRVDADAESLDLEAAVSLNSSVEPDCPLEGQGFYQGCIKAIVINHQPIWVRSMRQGRMRFINSIRDEGDKKGSQDDLEIFRSAGLLDDPPDDVLVTWWDEVIGHSRLLTDIEKMAQARKAERETIRLETDRLREIGIVDDPVWKGLEDNFAGYDVLSYDLVDGSQVNRMIEVKSTVASPLRFYLSRNEWETADRVGSSYFFHVWDMSVKPPRLYERTVEDVRPHIPSDNEKGKWTTAQIPLGAA